MAWSDPRTWVTGEIVTAAHLNQEVRDNLDAGFSDGVTGVDWTPTLRGATANPTVDFVEGRRFKIGGLQFLWVRWVLGDDPGQGSYDVTLPNAAVGIADADAAGRGTAIGSWQARDVSGPTTGAGTVSLISSNEAGFTIPQFNFGFTGLDTRVGANRPWTWADGDFLSMHVAVPVA